MLLSKSMTKVTKPQARLLKLLKQFNNGIATTRDLATLLYPKQAKKLGAGRAGIFIGRIGFLIASVLKTAHSAQRTA